MRLRKKVSAGLTVESCSTSYDETGLDDVTPYSSESHEHGYGRSDQTRHYHSRRDHSMSLILLWKLKQ